MKIEFEEQVINGEINILAKTYIYVSELENGVIKSDIYPLVVHDIVGFAERKKLNFDIISHIKKRMELQLFDAVRKIILTHKFNKPIEDGEGIRYEETDVCGIILQW